MNAIMKLAVVALGATGIVAGAALAQTTLNPNDPSNPATANYSISPNSNLKRDGSLSGPDVPAVNRAAMNDTSTTTTTTETVSTTTPAAEAPVAAAPVQDTTTTVADSTPAPRADRN